MPFTLGLDTGTSGTRALLIDETGRVAASETAGYLLQTPQPQWAEQDPETDWWRAAQTVLRAVLGKAGIGGDQIGCIGLTGQMHGSVFLDKSGAVLCPALLWCDSRTGAECDEITTRIGGADRLFEVIGQPVLTSFTAPKILWLRTHRPEIYARVAHILLPKDFIRYRLTGEFATEVSDASGTSLLDVRTRNWSQAMLDALEIPREWLPDVHESPIITGYISEAAAVATGLRAGTPVVGGGGDQAAGAVGCGIVRSGVVSSTIGTSGVIFAHTDTPVFDPRMRIQTFCHAVPGAWHLMGCVLSAGGSLRYFRDTFAPDIEYDALLAGAGSAPPGCEGLIFLPYLTGERTPYPDPDARGVFFGATLRCTRDWYTRAVLEGVAYAMQDSLALLDDMGLGIAEVRASGGGARAPFWLQIQADVTNQTHVTLSVDEGAAFGAALLAGVGIGTYASVEEACGAAIQPVARTVPNPDVVALYRRYHTVYRSLYPALSPLFKQVGQIV